MNSDGYYTDPLSQTFQGLLPVCFLFGAFGAMYATITLISQERENNLKAYMKMMGLSETSYISSYLVVHIIVCIPTLILCPVCLYVIYPQTNAFFTFMLTFLYSLSVFGVCLISV